MKLAAAWTSAGIGLRQTLAYRAEFIFWILTTTMPLVNLALWSGVASSVGQIGGFGPREFAAYFLAALAVRHLTSSWVVWQMNQEIREGAMSARLLRPVHPLSAYALENIGGLPVKGVMFTPVLLLAFWLAGADVATTAARMPALSISLFLTWFMLFSIMAAVGSLAFRWTSSLGLFEMWMLLYMLLSGYLLPLELLPDSATRALAWLPFRYMLALPVEILMGRCQDVWGSLGIQAGWGLAFAALAGFGWRSGRRHHQAVGG